MGKLSVLGAQRVKALESMLDDKMQEELNVVQTKDLKEIRMLALEEFGIYDKYQSAKELIEEANEMLKDVSAITGDTYRASLDYSSNYRNNSDFNERKHELENEHSGAKERNAIKAKYTRKKQMLWLCETLEEAKAIVGLEEETK